MRRSYSYIATPPGETIREQLEDRDMSQKEFAARMDLSEKHVSHLLNGKVELTPDVARRLEMVLGVPAEFWNRLEAIYREQLVKIKDENEMEEDKRIARQFPYKKMEQNGWVPRAESMTEKVVNLRKYFEVAKLTVLDQVFSKQLGHGEMSDLSENRYELLVQAQKDKRMARKHRAHLANAGT